MVIHMACFCNDQKHKNDSVYGSGSEENCTLIG